MSIARRSDQWDHTADVLARLVNPHRDRLKHPQPFTREDFHPFMEKRQPQRQGTIDDLISIFTTP